MAKPSSFYSKAEAAIATLAATAAATTGTTAPPLLVPPVCGVHAGASGPADRTSPPWACAANHSAPRRATVARAEHGCSFLNERARQRAVCSGVVGWCGGRYCELCPVSDILLLQAGADARPCDAAAATAADVAASDAAGADLLLCADKPGRGRAPGATVHDCSVFGQLQLYIKSFGILASKLASVPCFHPSSRAEEAACGWAARR